MCVCVCVCVCVYSRNKKSGNPYVCMSVYSIFTNFMYSCVVQYRNHTNENSEFLKFCEDFQSMYLYNI